VNYDISQPRQPTTVVPQAKQTHSPQLNRSTTYQTPVQQPSTHKAQVHQPPQPINAYPQSPDGQLRGRVVQNVPQTNVTQAPRYQPSAVQSPPPTNYHQPQHQPQPVYAPPPQQQDTSYQTMQMFHQMNAMNQSQVNESKQLLNQVQNSLEKMNLFMERFDKRLTSLESTAQTILKNQKANGQDDLSSFFGKNELDTLKKMQEQMESDMELAKRLQAEMEKETKQRETPKPKLITSTPTPTPRPMSTVTATPSPSSMQECPICTQRVPFLELEYHVNQCLEGGIGDSGKVDPSQQEKGSFWKRMFGPGPKKPDEANNQLVVRTTSGGKPQAGKSLPTPQVTQSMPMYPGTQGEYYQPFVYRAPYPQAPQMMPPMYGYQPQQIYYYPSNMQPGQKK
jgi:hypothetical protein